MNITSNRGGFIFQLNTDTNESFTVKASILSSQFYNVSGLGGLIYALNDQFDGVITTANYDYNITNCTFNTFTSQLGGMITV